MSEAVFTVANLLTVLRMGMTPFLVILVMQGQFMWALVVFVTAGVTDMLDGLIARRTAQLTRLGAVLDPIADKLLLSSSFIVLTWSSGLVVSVPTWLTVLTLSRDLLILISAMAIVMTLGARVFYPSWLGKLTTAAQLVTVGVVLLLNSQGQSVPGVGYMFLVTGVLTVASGIHYVFLAFAGRPSGPAPPLTRPA